MGSSACSSSDVEGTISGVSGMGGSLERTSWRQFCPFTNSPNFYLVAARTNLAYAGAWTPRSLPCKSCTHGVALVNGLKRFGVLAIVRTLSFLLAHKSTHLPIVGISWLQKRISHR